MSTPPIHKRAYYRCKFSAEYAIAQDKHPNTIYVREDSLTPAIDRWLAQLFDDVNIDETRAAPETGTGPDIAEQNRIDSACRRLKECDDKLAKYRQALEAGTDPTIVGEWIEEIRLARKAAEVARRPKKPNGRLTQPRSNDWSPSAKASWPSSKAPTPKTAKLSTGNSTSQSFVTTMDSCKSLQIPRRVLTNVSKGGLEPPRPFGHWLLRPARLPIPPLRRDRLKS